MNQVLSGGSAPCFLALDAKARFLAVANFAGGSVAIFAVLRDGSISDTIAVAQHVGAGSLCGRQDKPHPHSVAFDPTGEWIVVADLGLNQLLVYRFSSAEKVDARS